jgi:ADA HAT complex component 1
MLGLLPWNAYNKPDMSTAQKSPVSRPTSSASSAGVKRKRTTTSEDSDAPRVTDSTKFAEIGLSSEDAQLSTSNMSLNHTTVPEGYPTPLSSPTDVKMANATDGALVKPEQRESRARKVIQQQINLEILLKHNELRLIEQELAKCQTSLEQLRRCSEIPYPATQLADTVSRGIGPAIRNAFPERAPVSPAPWGVTDGPYSRHYSKWLLPDTRFDGGEPTTPAPISGKRPAKGRIRGSFAEDHSVGLSSRSNRGSKQLQSLPAGYGQPKEKATGPLLLKRKSDGVMVKLVCPDCGRHDFGSAQGFINHCRIGHGRNFTSHDAAAEKCGEPVEYDDKGAMVGVQPVATLTSSFVHPLIRSAHLLEAADAQQEPARAANLDGATDAKVRKVATGVSPIFRGSTTTPHLSSLVKERGLGLDLQQIVNDAKTKAALHEVDDEEVEEDDESPTPTEATNGLHPRVAGTRQIAKPSKSPQASPLLQSRIPAVSSGLSRAPTSQHHVSGTGDSSVQPGEPSPTTESNQAPSLIDDDEEFEPQSPESSSESDHMDEEEVEFHVQDEEDSQQVTMRTDFQPTCAQTATPGTEGPRVRQPSSIRRQAESREEKHVTFVSPSPAPEMSTPDRKRRKIAK